MIERRSMRAGAAAFALGLSLAGPQAAGLATADTGDSDTAGVSSAGTGTPHDAHRSAKAAATRIGRPDTRPEPAPAASGPGPVRVPGSAAAVAGNSRPDRPASETRPATVPKMAAAQSVRRVPQVSHAASSVPTAISPVADAVAAARQDAGPAAATTPAGIQTASAVAFDPAQALAEVNTAIAGLFDAASNWLSTLPANPVSDLLSGALLLARRTLFDQAPTAAPVQTTPYRSHGQILGTLGAADAEGDPLTYQVITDPVYGTVVVDAEGHYTYTPGTDFAGSLTPDSFTVRITDTNGGFNLLDPFGERYTDVVVAAPDPHTPFFNGNNDDLTVFLADTAARITVGKQNGNLVGTVALQIPSDTALRWLDEKGRNGTVSVAEVASDWSKITDAGAVRLGISYADDRGEYTVILDSVQAEVDENGAYILSGQLAPDVHDGDGVDCYYDVVGAEYKSRYESFLEAISGTDSFQQEVTGANLFLDTWSVADYVTELDGAPVRVAVPFPFAAVAGATTTDGPFADSQSLENAVQFARNGVNLGGPADPVFSLAQFAPACTASGTCDGTFYYQNLATPDTVTVAQGTFAYQGRSVDVAFGFGGAAYGYVYVPAGVWDKLDYDMYSAGVFLAATAGPSLTLNLGPNGGDFALAAQQLPQAQYYNATPYGTIAVTGDLSATLDAKLGLPAGTGKTLSAAVLGTAAAVLTYNTGGVPGFQWGGSDFTVTSDFTDFASISGVSLTLTLNPAVTAAWGLFTPDSTPILGRVSFLEVGLGYTDAQLAATLNLADPAALTLSSKGSLGFSAGLVPSLTDELTYTGSLDLGYSTGNLLA